MHSEGEVGPERLQSLSEALQNLAPLLEPDGFRLRLGDLHGENVEVVIIATEAACSDCLVPEETLEAILRSEIEKQGETVGVLSVRREGFDP